jgi:hypothetical protein
MDPPTSCSDSDHRADTRSQLTHLDGYKLWVLTKLGRLLLQRPIYTR